MLGRLIQMTQGGFRVPKQHGGASLKKSGFSHSQGTRPLSQLEDDDAPDLHCNLAMHSGEKAGFRRSFQPLKGAVLFFCWAAFTGRIASNLHRQPVEGSTAVADSVPHTKSMR